MDDLKPCPFCGRDSEMIEQGGAHPLHFWRPTCKDPLCAGFNFKRYCNAEIAIEKWNRRADNG